MPKNLSFVKGVVGSDDLLPLNVNRKTLKESNIIKVISKKIVRKAIEILHKLAEKDESKNDKDDNIDDKTKEVDINEVAETDNGELVVDVANAAPPTPQDNMNTTTAAAAEEGEDDNNVGAGGGGNPEVKYRNDDDDKEDVMDVIGILPPLVSCRVERLKCLNTEIERAMEQYL